MERRTNPDLQALLAALDERIAKGGRSVAALQEERNRLVAEINIWRQVGRRAGDRSKLEMAS
jgi:hypothetical protein